MKIIKIEYRLKENDWKCYIFAKDMDDATNYINNTIKAPIFITSVEEMFDVHGVTEKTGYIKKDLSFPCPYCENTYKTQKALNIHIGRKHKNN